MKEEIEKSTQTSNLSLLLSLQISLLLNNFHNLEIYELPKYKKIVST